MQNLFITKKVTNRETISFNQYLKDISMIDVLSAKEEMLLSEKASKGDVSAINELIERNLRFVVTVAKQYATTQNPLEDLVNEGNIGLIIAAKKFNPNMGFKFISYAVWWIRKVIMEHITNHGRLVRLPSNRVNSLSKLDKEISQLEQKFGKLISVQEAINIFIESNDNGDSIDNKLEEYKNFDILSSYQMDSLDRNIGGDDGDGTALSDMISDESVFKSTDHEVNLNDLKKQINSVLDILKPRDKKIMIALFGLDGSLPRTLDDIGNEVGISREMVRQVREKSLVKIRERVKKYELI